MIKPILPLLLAVLLQLNMAAAMATPDSKELSQIAEQTASLDQRFAPGSINTAELADEAVKVSSVAQQRLQAWYVQAERACHDQFFVNDCVNDVKQQRRQHILILQRISLEAKALQRKLHIEQLDRDLAERQSKP